MHKYDQLDPGKEDEIMSLSAIFYGDGRPPGEKFKLFTGEVQDQRGQHRGQPYVTKAVNEARNQLALASTGYVPPIGDKNYLWLHAAHVVFGNDLWMEMTGGKTDQKPKNMAWGQTLGGTGALETAAEIIKKSSPPGEHPKLLLDDGWQNHQKIFRDFQISSARRENPKTRKYDHAEYLQRLKALPANATICIQAMGYNPDGLDRENSQWDEILKLAQAKSLRLIIDMAYLGLAKGFAKDNYVVRQCVKMGIQAFICCSNSKNFGLPSKRVGSLYVTNLDPAGAVKVQDFIQSETLRKNGTPPDGSAIVATVLGSNELRKEHLLEVMGVRDQVQENRMKLARTLGSWVMNGSGIFVKLQPGDLNKRELAELQMEGIFVPPSGRVNLSAIPPEKFEAIAKALAEVARATNKHDLSASYN